MRCPSRILFTLCVVVLAAYAVYTSRGWPLGTRLFPWFVGIPLLALSLVQMGLEIHGALRAGPAANVDTGDLRIDWSVSAGTVARRAAGYYGGLLGLFFGIWLLGFFIAIPCYAFLYLKLQAREGWRLASALTLGVFIFFVGLFDQILHIAWPIPLLRGPEEFLKSLLPFVE